jgi:hypothetical protein
VQFAKTGYGWVGSSPIASEVTVHVVVFCIHPLYAHREVTTNSECTIALVNLIDLLFTWGHDVFAVPVAILASHVSRSVALTYHSWSLPSPVPSRSSGIAKIVSVHV